MVTLYANDSINLSTGVVTRSDQRQTPVPSRSGQSYPARYPLVGHRQGLRANDMITLASAFTIIAQHGGTAHMMSVIDGSMITLTN